MTLNEFLTERARFFRLEQRHPNKVTLHPADAADLLLELKPLAVSFTMERGYTIAGATLHQSEGQAVGRAKFELVNVER